MLPSSVHLPLAAPGRLTCDINLASVDDQRRFIDKLKSAIDLLCKQPHVGAASSQARPGQAAPAAAPPPAAAAIVPPVPGPSAPQAAPPLFPRVVPPPGTAAVPPAAAPAATAAPAAAAPPSAAAAAQRPPVVAPTAPQRPQQPAAAPPLPRQPAAAPATAGPPLQAAAAGGGGGMSWQLCWTTDAADHSGEAVGSMAYVPSIAGLPGGEGHAGWLVSSSRGLLNLWEASPSGGRGEAALMCMHSQGTDYSSICLDAERGTCMLLSASMDRSSSEWVTAHSLEVDTLLAPKGRCPMPHAAASKKPGQNCLALASLHGFGGPLAETVVASYGGALVVWPVGSSSKPVASNSSSPGSSTPKALWKAHDSLITALHKSSFGLSLFSGAADGKVHLWHMREKPNQPNAVFTQQGRITGIHQINDTQLLTTAGDGRLMVWDLRNAAAGPVKFAVPDSRPILRMALSPFADSAALATTGGIFQVDLLDSACHATPVATGALKTPVTALTWNTATSEIVVAGGPGPAGTISVYK